MSHRLLGWLLLPMLLGTGGCVTAGLAAMGPVMDGILGNTFLSRFTVTLDPERGLLRLTSR